MAHPLSPHDVVPRLRKDLNVTSPPIGTGEDVIEVGAAGSTDRVMLHGFELQIALMLDGRRTVQDVLLNCERLGLPIDAEALEGFVRHLEQWSLLARGDALKGPRGRDTWAPPVRALYCSALHDVRSELDPIARQELAQLLEVAPDNVEAKQLVEWIDARERSPRTEKPFQELLREVEQGWSEDLRPSRLEGWVPASRWPVIGLALGIAAVIAGAMVPLPRLVAAGAQVGPATSAGVRAAYDGVVGDVAVAEGQRVAEGDVLFTWDPGALELKIIDASARAEVVRQRAREAFGRSPAGAALWKRLQRADTAVEQARATLMSDQRDWAGDVSPDGMTRAEQRFWAADAELEAALAAVDALAPGDSVEAMQLQAIALEIDLLEQQAAEVNVLAPAAGQLTHFALKPGDAVGHRQKLAQVDDLGRLKVVVTVTPAQAASVRVGEPITLHFGRLERATTVTAVSGYELTAEVPNPDGALKTGSATVSVELTPRSIFERVSGS